MGGIAGSPPGLPAPPGVDIGDGETRAIGPTPNSGRPVEPALVDRPVDREPALPSLCFGALATCIVTRDRARVQRSAPRCGDDSTEDPNRHRPEAPCDNPADDDSARPPAGTRPSTSPVDRPAGSRQGQAAFAGADPAVRSSPCQAPRGLPLIFRLGLIAAVLALGLGVIYVGTGGLGVVVGGIGSTLGGFVSGVTSTPSPRATIASITDPPSLQQPSEPYTSEPTVDLVVTVPAGLAGDQVRKIRVYLTLPDQAPTAIQEASISDAPKTVIPASS